MDAARRILRGEPPRSVLSEQLSSADLGTGTHGLLGAGRFVSPFSNPDDLISTVFQLTEDHEFGDEGQQLRVQGVLDGDEDGVRIKNQETEESFEVSLDKLKDLMDDGVLL